MMRMLLILMSALALSGCATPFVQPAMAPPPGFTGPRIEDPVLPGTLGAFIVDDSARLPFLRWGPEEAEVVIAALHGMNDFSAAFHLAGPAWAERGIATYAYDQRGFGRAPGRGLWAGEGRMTQDLRTVVDLMRARHPRATLAVVGESMGGAVAISAFASDNPPSADRVILLAPAVWGWSSQTLPNRYSLRVAAGLFGDRAVEPPDWAVRDIRATDNLVQLVRNGADPAFIRSTRFDSLSGLVDLMESATRKLGQTQVPTLLMYGARDDIIETRPMRRALERAGASKSLRTAWYPQGYHLLNRDLQAATVYRDVEAWLRQPDEPLPSGAPPVLPNLPE
ncbi:alpha-beta hydrolase superfamily lysophospholipase [Brevundimonas variabilis]|uniref:Alpha-beta hydrolase superfamily lysophospholipase n=2 Tax=Brevundimonas variabilis TaxID=74312 RepID=A0A7W9FEU3_9CAUL|nr:alpha-beta hydrolase superfamily lysophospholipase [Brevundimonas variabilis]